MRGYNTVDIEKENQVATISIKSGEEWDGSDLHWDLGEVFSELRGDLDIRVVVLTGHDDDVFYLPPTNDNFRVEEEGYGEETFERIIHPNGAFKAFTGILRTHQTMAELEKPIIAKVNGDAIGFASNVIWSCDLIVAERDARIIDIHLDMGEVEDDGTRYGPSFGVAPGDGGAGLIPYHLPPAIANEYLMFSEPFTGEALSDLGVINYAVESDELDELVNEMVGRLLDRSALALAWTKRLTTRNKIPQLNRTLDAAAAYEMVSYLHMELMGSDNQHLE